MSQAIEDNTKALNRLTNVLLTIFRIEPSVGTTSAPAPVPAKTTASTPAAPKAGAGTTAPEKTQPAPVTQAAAPAPIPMVRESASKLTLHMAASKEEGQGKEAAVALLAEYQDAEGNPVKGVKAMQEADVPDYLKRIIAIIGEGTARTVLGVK